MLTALRLRHLVPGREQRQVQPVFVPAHQAQQSQVRGSGARWQRAAEWQERPEQEHPERQPKPQKAWNVKLALAHRARADEDAALHRVH